MKTGAPVMVALFLIIGIVLDYLLQLATFGHRRLVSCATRGHVIVSDGALTRPCPKCESGDDSGWSVEEDAS